jgi:hypothetical protein
VSCAASIGTTSSWPRMTVGWPLRANAIPDTGDWLDCISRSNSRGVPSGVGTVARKLQREIILLSRLGPGHFAPARGSRCGRPQCFSHRALGPDAASFTAPSTRCWGSVQNRARGLAVVARINAIHDCMNGRLTRLLASFPPGHPTRLTILASSPACTRRCSR